jgi:RecA-family ATPase
VTYDIAAAVTNGTVPYSLKADAEEDTTKITPTAMKFIKGDPAQVLYLSIENDLEHVVKQRFDNCDGYASYFHSVKGLKRHDGDERQVITLDDVDHIDGLMAKYNPRLVIIDPIQAYLGPKVNMYRANEVRPIMAGLAFLAEKYMAAILIIRHFTKAKAGRAIHSGAGSYDFTAIVRSEMHAGHDADDPTKRAFILQKSNVASTGQSLAYLIDKKDKFIWLGESDLTAYDLQAPESKKEKAKPGTVEEAEEFLANAILKGPRLADELIAESKKINISEKTLRRAKGNLKVRANKIGFSGGWEWMTLDWYKKYHGAKN